MEDLVVALALHIEESSFDSLRSLMMTILIG